MQDIGSWYNISIVFRSRPLLDERIYFHINRQLPVNTVLDALNDLKIAQFTMKEGKIIVELQYVIFGKSDTAPNEKKS